MDYQLLSERIDRAFSSLLMAKDILDRVVPESDHEQARQMAGHLAVDLVDLAVREICPFSDLQIVPKQNSSACPTWPKPAE